MAAQADKRGHVLLITHRAFRCSPIVCPSALLVYVVTRASAPAAAEEVDAPSQRSGQEVTVALEHSEKSGGMKVVAWLGAWEETRREAEVRCVVRNSPGAERGRQGSWMMGAA